MTKRSNNHTNAQKSGGFDHRLASHPSTPRLDGDSGERDEDIEVDEDEDDDVDDDAPKVVLGTVDDLGRGPAHHATRPVWILHEEHEPTVGLFERIPEASMSPADISEILASLRRFTDDNATDLQMLLGPTDKLRIGFHTSAALEEVVESFEDDGFDVLLGIAHGGVELPSDDPIR